MDHSVEIECRIQAKYERRARNSMVHALDSEHEYCSPVTVYMARRDGV